MGVLSIIKGKVKIYSNFIFGFEVIINFSGKNKVFWYTMGMSIVK